MAVVGNNEVNVEGLGLDGRFVVVVCGRAGRGAVDAPRGGCEELFIFSPFTGVCSLL